MASQVLTANRLIDGDVVYWHAGRWVEALGEAELFADETQAGAALERAKQSVARNEVVNPYLFDVRVQGDGLYPVKEREIIRAMGPSVHDGLGKRALGLTPASILKAAALRDAPAAPPSAAPKDDDVSI
ncbi:MAG TPA: DUF2849 domain-containing protein [Rhizomicrobium sp.]|nr:DUF2849 domain-containing protein [Rhizomicrobium sp.]